jgi:hypothetical protein
VPTISIADDAYVAHFHHCQVPLGLISSKVTYILWPLSRFGKVELKPNYNRVSVNSVDAMRVAA